MKKNEFKKAEQTEKEYAEDVASIMLSIKYHRRGNLRKETVFTK